MPIEFNCHVCGKVLRTADDKAGRTAKCPGCGESLTVPLEDTASDDSGAVEEFEDEEFEDFQDEEFASPARSGQAMRACPMCGESISRQSSRCEYCGESVRGGRRQRQGRRSGRAAERVSGPAIGLMVTAGLGLAVQLLSVVGNLFFLMAAQQPGFQPGVQPFGGALQGGMGLVINVVGIVIGIIILVGALKMKRLDSYGWAMTGSIIAMVPFISPCCLVGLPIGVWALVVLNDDEVKNSFPG